MNKHANHHRKAHRDPAAGAAAVETVRGAFAQGFTGSFKLAADTFKAITSVSGRFIREDRAPERGREKAKA